MRFSITSKIQKVRGRLHQYRVVSVVRDKIVVDCPPPPVRNGFRRNRNPRVRNDHHASLALFGREMDSKSALKFVIRTFVEKGKRRGKYPSRTLAWCINRV